jgi:hypothetical protein
MVDTRRYTKTLKVIFLEFKNVLFCFLHEIDLTFDISKIDNLFF